MATAHPGYAAALRASRSALDRTQPEAIAVTPLLSAIFFVSGAAGLVFETLWFRRMGLVLGNGVWASSLVLSAFMLGLALGNLLAARYGARVRRPLVAYALLEACIAVAGVAIVWGSPAAAAALAPRLGGWLDAPLLLNALRLAIAFAVLLVPSTAMGATLPLFVGALFQRDRRFGSVLGWLYGWNTLGAVVGAVAGEAFLIGQVGVRGTALVAGAADLLAGAVALSLARGTPSAAPAGPPDTALARPTSWRPIALCAAAWGCGFVLLALEVVWFRFLFLFARPDPLVFAVMLGVVLSGLGLGGLIASAWLRRGGSGGSPAALAFAAGCVVVGVYALFPRALEPIGTVYVGTAGTLWLAAVLTLPSALLSGVLFTAIGAALQREIGGATAATGWLTFANTTGGAVGSLVAGFVLLPGLGIERSLFALALGYGVVGAGLWAAARGAQPARVPWRSAAIPAAALGAALLLFPHGLMGRRYLTIPVERSRQSADFTVKAIREGRTETSILLERRLRGEALDHQLITDGYSMAGTTVSSRRYMGLYAWWPVALAPAPKQALLISFGTGSTARALTATASLERIDVVDISRDILALADLVHPDPRRHPLRDPRVHVHVEDGRFFLQATDRRYDLITGEPPPPKLAGIVNLYTAEYFRLVYDHLAPGGLHTYWLPVHSLTVDDAKAILRAHCSVFADCSLWVGADQDWMLVGSRGARFHRSEAEFRRQWEDPAVGAELREVGIELPEQLGALFLADAETLAAWTRDAAPVTDDFPKRISHHPREASRDDPVFEAWRDAEAAARRFAASAFVRGAWPPGLRERTLAYFPIQAIVNAISTRSGGRELPAEQRLEALRTVLGETPLETLPLWQVGTTRQVLEILGRPAARRRSADELFVLAAGQLAARRYRAAAEAYGRVLAARPADARSRELQLFALCMAGDGERAQQLARRHPVGRPGDAAAAASGRWLREHCDAMARGAGEAPATGPADEPG